LASKVDVEVVGVVFVVGQIALEGVVTALVNEVRFESVSTPKVCVVQDPSKSSFTPVSRPASS
jgi:hypothetical protein